MKTRKGLGALLALLLILLLTVTLNGTLAEETLPENTEQPCMNEAPLPEEEPVIGEPVLPRWEPDPTDEQLLGAETLPEERETVLLPDGPETEVTVLTAVAITENADEKAPEAEEEKPKYKNGNEGFHTERKVTDTSADWKINAGAHKNDEYTGRDVDLNLLHVHAGLGAGVGAFKVETPNGETHEGYGLNAGLDAELTGLEYTGDVRLGTTKYNVHGGGTFKAGEGAVAAGLTVGEVDGKVVVGLKGNAEADLVEAGVEGGVTLCGVEMNGHVSGKVGVGFKLRLGYEDGKFGCDLGAAMGIGIEFGFEVDVGAIAENAEELGKDIAELAEKAADKVEELAEKAAEKTKELAKETAKTVAKAAVKTVEAVKQVGNAITNGAAKAFGWLTKML